MNETGNTRRGVLRSGLALVAGGTIATAATTLAARQAAAQDKLAKEAVQYQNMPKDGNKCATCVNFVTPNACQIVAGEINPEGWCVAWGPKSS